MGGTDQTTWVAGLTLSLCLGPSATEREVARAHGGGSVTRAQIQEADRANER